MKGATPRGPKVVIANNAKPAAIPIGTGCNWDTAERIAAPGALGTNWTAMPIAIASRTGTGTNGDGPLCSVTGPPSIDSAVPTESARKNTQPTQTRTNADTHWSAWINHVPGGVARTPRARSDAFQCTAQRDAPCRPPHTTKCQAAPCHRPPSSIVNIRFSEVRT